MPRPDEGLIHAWLDGQLPPEEAERVEQLVATDPAWQAAVAEARGLVAASSRILAALDDVPRGVLPAGGTVARPARRLPWWTKAAAAIVVIAGGSTLVLQRSSSPVIDELPPVSVPVATKPLPTPVTPPSAAQTKSEVPAERHDVAKAVTPAPATLSAKAARTEALKPQAQASVQAQAEALVPMPVPPVPEARAVGGVLQNTAGGAPAQRVADQRVADQRVADQRVADQRVDAQRAREQQAGAQRDAAVPVMTSMASPLVAKQAANALTGVVVTGMAAAPTVAIGSCYAMRDSKTSAATGIVMRGDKQVADTLFLAPLRALSPVRGWIMVRENVLRGVLTTEADGRGMMLVTAAPVSCTAP